MLKAKSQEDLEAIFEYMFDGETGDFFVHLESEEYIVEEGILTQEEVEVGLNDDDRKYDISDKAACNPKTKHIYANLFRLFEDFVTWRDKHGGK